MATTAEEYTTALMQLKAQLDSATARIDLLQATGTATPQEATQHENRVIDTRVLQRPAEFAGEQDKWPAWSFGMRAYAGAVDAHLLALMKRSAITKEEIISEALNEVELRHSTQLYAILSLGVKGAALQIVMNTTEGNGAEVWRKFTAEYEPRGPSRFRGMLQEILPPSLGAGSDLAMSIEAWERRTREYEEQSVSLIHI